jgi:hypothetical protein
MTNRELSYIVKDQKPLVLEENESVGYACRAMRSRGVGSVLVVTLYGWSRKMTMQPMCRLVRR